MHVEEIVVDGGGALGWGPGVGPGLGPRDGALGCGGVGPFHPHEPVKAKQSRASKAKQATQSKAKQANRPGQAGPGRKSRYYTTMKGGSR